MRSRQQVALTDRSPWCSDRVRL